MDYLVHHPTRKQVLNDISIIFRDVPIGNRNNIHELILAVRTVRNNLFHGAKYPFPIGIVEEPSRNCKLVNSCIVILKECLELNEDVKRVFFNYNDGS